MLSWGNFYFFLENYFSWICKKFYMGAADNLISDFEKGTHTLLDAEKQMQKEEKSTI